MNHFHRRSRGMSSQLSTYTRRKKIANVIVGKSTRAACPSPGARTAPAVRLTGRMVHPRPRAAKPVPRSGPGPRRESAGHPGRRRQGAGVAALLGFGGGGPASPFLGNHSFLTASITACAMRRPPA